MPRWIIAAVAALAAAGLVAAAAAPAAKHPQRAGFRHVLAAKLGAQLDKPARDVLVALKAAPKPAKLGARPTRAQRQARRAATVKRRAAWTASMAKSLDVAPEQVTAAVRALVKERLDSLVEDGWLTREQADRRANKAWIGFLRIR